MSFESVAAPVAAPMPPPISLAVALLGLFDGVVGVAALLGIGVFRLVLVGAAGVVAQGHQHREVIRADLLQAAHRHQRELLGDEDVIQRPAQERVLGVEGAVLTAAAA